MSDEEFTYQDYEAVRERLVEVVNQRLTDQDKAFLLRFKQADPDWSIYDFERFPSIQWKLRNLTTLKKTNPQKTSATVRVVEGKTGLITTLGYFKSFTASFSCTNNVKLY